MKSILQRSLVDLSGPLGCKMSFVIGCCYNAL